MAALAITCLLATTQASIPGGTGQTIVKTYDQLLTAIDVGAHHIEIQEHLDLSDIKPLARIAYIFDTHFVVGETKSIRVSNFSEQNGKITDMHKFIILRSA
jgi:hypothetical protein